MRASVQPVVTARDVARDLEVGKWWGKLWILGEEAWRQYFDKTPCWLAASLFYRKPSFGRCWWQENKFSAAL